ncbi:hypothetical protein J437_LFUL012183, partial [Ladona fulva]
MTAVLSDKIRLQRILLLYLTLYSQTGKLDLPKVEPRGNTLRDLPLYEYGSSPKGKVLVVQFPDPDNQFHNSTLDALRAKTEKSFENIGYEPLKWNGYEPKKANRKTFLDELKE